VKKSRYTVEQIIATLKEVEAGRPVADILREKNISQATFYSWRSKYGGMEVSEAKRLKDLEEENRRLKQLVADQALDIQALKAVNAKKW
jgi:putative transposase